VKVVSFDGKFWLEETDGLVAVGLTEEFFNQIGVLWSFIPRGDRVALEEGQIFANVESSKRLAPFRSPVAGTISKWSEKLARPDQLTAADWLVLIKVKE
jgi:glycine cleavage system H lipoate-binding protein